MSNYAIRVEGLGKRYRIGERQRYKALRDVLTDVAYAPVRAAGRLLRGEGRGAHEDSHIWALKDVSFEVQHGEVLGIIGRNGAGKSTLLKILSRITEPTEGEVRLRGRVGSLLEVGTGFHPELTGRDNVYLNGAILGMHRHEIERKFDEIVAFAEIEQFLDTPVKHYSSGMYVRLAFAVAAHLEPEILLVDEVLAVGDAAFQKKCLGKMEEIAGYGRTVLFVSHQLAMIRQLCERVVLLDHGGMCKDGPAEAVVGDYLQMMVQNQDLSTVIEFEEDLSKPAQILRAEVYKLDAEATPAIDTFDQLAVSIVYKIRQPIGGMAVILAVSRNGERLFASFDTDDSPDLLQIRHPGLYSTIVRLPCPLKGGRYSLTINLGRPKGGSIDVHSDILHVNIEELSFDTSMCSYSSSRPGSMAARLIWHTTQDDGVAGLCSEAPV